MLKSLIAVVIAAPLFAGAAHAQTHPYAGLEDRPIKALSADDLANLRAGRGMGMALPAELNRYPGPAHALENGDALGLSPEQKQALGQQFETMHNDAVALGEQIIAREAALDEIFKAGNANVASIDEITAELGNLYGKLRAVHLRTHLATKAALTTTQLAMYQSLRGYDGAGSHPVHKH